MKYLFEPSFVNISNQMEYFDEISKSLSTNSKRTFFYLNSHSYYIAEKNLKFRKALNKDIVLFGQLKN